MPPRCSAASRSSAAPPRHAMRHCLVPARRRPRHRRVRAARFACSCCCCARLSVVRGCRRPRSPCRSPACHSSSPRMCSCAPRWLLSSCTQASSRTPGTALGTARTRHTPPRAPLLALVAIYLPLLATACCDERRRSPPSPSTGAARVGVRALRAHPRAAAPAQCTARLCAPAAVRVGRWRAAAHGRARGTDSWVLTARANRQDRSRSVAKTELRARAIQRGQPYVAAGQKHGAGQGVWSNVLPACHASIHFL
jgi:hypothetical protein